MTTTTGKPVKNERVCTVVERSQYVDNLAAFIASDARAVEYVYLFNVNTRLWKS